MKLKKLGLVMISVLAILAVVYGGGVWYFQTHFLPGQIVQNAEVGLKTTNEATALVDAMVASEVVTIEVIGTTLETTFDQLGVGISSQTLVEETLAKQNSWLWPLQILEVDATATQTYQVDTEQLTTTLFTLGVTNPEGKTPTSNAGITKSETEFVLSDEVSGTLLNTEQVHEIMQLALMQGLTAISVTDAQEQPTISGNELQPIVDEANAMVQAKHTLTINDEAIEIQPSQIMEWVTIDETNQIIVDEAGVWNFVESLVTDYTVMATASTLNTATMQQSGGMSGSTLNVNATAQAIVDAILTGKSQTIGATMQTITSPTQIQGVGDTYVQVSLTEQRLWYYQNGQLVIDQAVVTGDDTQGWGTITGVYSIMAKERDAVLEGYSYGWDYSVPVEYWMPIHSDGTGIHDASWHSTFGGSVYLGNGSHGCINLPPAVAKQLFESVTVGTPVVIYK